MSDVGIFLKMRRKKAQITQVALVEKMEKLLGEKYPITTISKIESGNRGISFIEASAMSVILKFPLEDLAELVLPNSEVLNKEIEELLEDYTDFPIPYEVIQW